MGDKKVQTMEEHLEAGEKARKAFHENLKKSNQDYLDQQKGKKKDLAEQTEEQEQKKSGGGGKKNSDK